MLLVPHAAIDNATVASNAAAIAADLPILKRSITVSLAKCLHTRLPRVGVGYTVMGTVGSDDRRPSELHSGR